MSVNIDMYGKEIKLELSFDAYILLKEVQAQKRFNLAFASCK